MNDEIILGAADVYMYEFSGNSFPTNSEIEQNIHCVGHTSGGASVNYKPTKYDVENSYGKIVKSFITKEEITAKTGLLSWKMENLALLSTAKITTDSKTKIKKVVFGGTSSLKNILVRFVHTKTDGNKIRFTMIGNAGNGFEIPFNSKELVVDAEITAIEYFKNFLASFEEETASTGEGDGPGDEKDPGGEEPSVNYYKIAALSCGPDKIATINYSDDAFGYGGFGSGKFGGSLEEITDYKLESNVDGTYDLKVKNEFNIDVTKIETTGNEIKLVDEEEGEIIIIGIKEE